MCAGIKGAGIGLRSAHFDELLRRDDEGLWLELLADNWLYDGLTREYLSAFQEKYPLTLHSVGLSLGGVAPLDMEYLSALKELLSITQSQWLSDHLCFTHVHGYHFPDLLPLPYTEESVRHISKRIETVQDVLGMQILVENVSAYLEYQESHLTEAEFIAAICQESDCGLLLDVNNAYVNERNLGHDAWKTLTALPLDRVKEIHLAGFQDRGNCVIDTHDHPVASEVWQLYAKLIGKIGPRPTLIEWDNKVPELSVLLAEAQKARHIIDQARLPASAQPTTQSAPQPTTQPTAQSKTPPQEHQHASA